MRRLCEEKALFGKPERQLGRYAPPYWDITRIIHGLVGSALDS